MDVRRVKHVRSVPAGEPLKSKNQKQDLPSPSHLTNGIFLDLFFFVAYFPLHQWREKIRTSIPLHVVTLFEMVAIVSFIAYVIYLMSFFGIGFILDLFVYSYASSDDELELDDDACIAKDDARACIIEPQKLIPKPKIAEDNEKEKPIVDLSEDDKEMFRLVV